MLLCLLTAAIAVMVFISKSSHRQRPDHPAFNSDYVRAGGDTLNIAIEMNPAVYMVNGDSITGRDYQLLRQISSRFGRPLKFYPFVPLQRAKDGLLDGSFDIIVASFPLTTEMKDEFLMTDPVYLDREILVQSARDPITSQIQLGGDTVWITANSPFKSRLANMSDEIGDTIYIKSDPEYSAESLFILTARGIIKFAVINEGIARELAPHYPQVDINTPISFTQFQSWALRKDNQALCDSLNHWLTVINTIDSIASSAH